ERKLVDRAKLFLMRSQGLSEDEAYQRLRRTAMREGRRMGQVAEALVLSMGLLDDGLEDPAPKKDAP
ncbi:MAG: ANTAR domain-containing protein, partial [Devosiaceae bacterium]|nr:ANTAR domain-containing protein [Devosiaceae bacterium MH13]